MQDGLAITQPRFEADTFGGEDPDFGYFVKEFLNDRRGTGNDAGWDSKWAG